MAAGEIRPAPLERGRKISKPLWRCLDKESFKRLIRTRYDNHADDYEQKSECGFQAAAGRQQGAAPAHQRLPRKPSQPQERKRCSDAESEHRQRNLTEVLFLCREQRCGSKRGSHTRTPYGTQEHADPELPREAVGLFCCELAVSPVSNGSSGGRKADLKGWEQQYAPHNDHQRRRNIAQPVRIKPDRMASRRQEQSNRDKRQR